MAVKNGSLATSGSRPVRIRCQTCRWIAKRRPDYETQHVFGVCLKCEGLMLPAPPFEARRLRAQQEARKRR